MNIDEQIDRLAEAKRNGLALSAVREQCLEIFALGGFPTERAYGPSGPITAMYVAGRWIPTPDAELTGELVTAMRQWFNEQERLQGEKE